MVISRIITHIIDKERKSNLEKPNATHNAHPKVCLLYTSPSPRDTR